MRKNNARLLLAGLVLICSLAGCSNDTAQSPNSSPAAGDAETPSGGTVDPALVLRDKNLQKMRKVGIAVLRHHDDHGGLPSNLHRRNDPQGPALLSWRVAVLPYLGEEELYKEFHLDEPWDSEHNKTLLPRMPAYFALADNLPAGMTNMIAPQGENAMLGEGFRAYPALIDGSGSTVAFLEVAPANAVPWTRPEDFVFDPAAPDAISQLGQPDSDVFLVCMGDQIPMVFPKSMPAEALQALIDIRDGKLVDPRAYQVK